MSNDPDIFLNLIGISFRVQLFNLLLKRIVRALGESSKNLIPFKSTSPFTSIDPSELKEGVE